MIRFLLRILGLLSLVNWIRPSFQDDNGNASYRRLTPFFYTGLAGYMVIADKLPINTRQYAFTALLVAAAYYAAVITFQNVYALYLAFKGQDLKGEKTQVKEEVKEELKEEIKASL